MTHTADRRLSSIREKELNGPAYARWTHSLPVHFFAFFGVAALALATFDFTPVATVIVSTVFSLGGMLIAR